MSDRVLTEIIKTAKKYHVEKVVLFGSRARKDNSDTSDYDIAVFGKALSAIDKARLNSDIEEIATLKKIDIVYVSEDSADELTTNIRKDGVILYEQT